MTTHEFRSNEGYLNVVSNQLDGKNFVSEFSYSAISALQPKFRINQPDDVYEQEADQAADQVMRMTSPFIQLKNTSTYSLHRKCAHCEKEEMEIQRKDLNNDGRRSEKDLERYVGNLHSGGQNLPDEVRSFFEPKLGADFSNVKIHNDDSAAKSASSINALAYTSGNNVVFNSGQYNPNTDSGKRLLAHELTHVIQQGNTAEKISQKKKNVIDKRNVIQPQIQRSIRWEGADVHETVDLADTVVTQNEPVTWLKLNGKIVKFNILDTAGTIKAPGINTFKEGTRWIATVNSVPEQVGGNDETVLKPGPWVKAMSKTNLTSINWEETLHVAKIQNIDKCKGAGTISFTVKGKPSDDELYKANRIHENHHSSDDKAAFESVVGRWDKGLQDAKDKHTKFGGDTPDDATATLLGFMGGTPDNIAEQVFSSSTERGLAFHDSPEGRHMEPFSLTINKDCSVVSLEVERGFPPAEL